MDFLEQALISKRINEMNRFGRARIYPKIREFLPEKRARVLDLVNHGLAMVDDTLDINFPPEGQLENIIQMFRLSYFGEVVNASTDVEKVVVELGSILKEMSCVSFLKTTDYLIGKKTYQEVLNYWETEKINFQRKWKILNRKKLDEIARGIGSSVALQVLYILDSPKVYNEFIPLSRAYGLAVKLADNLCDYKEDIANGFVNIPQKDINYLGGVSIENGRVVNVDLDNLNLSKEYIDREYKRVGEVFASADRLMLLARARRPIWSKKTDEKLSLLGQFCNTWFNQAREFAK